MSTQRREDRWQHRSYTEHVNRSSRIWLAFIAWFVRVIAAVGTAPPKAVVRLSQARLATNSLQSDRLFAQLAPFVEQDIRRGSPPFGMANRQAGSRSSLPLPLFPPVLASVHPSLPNYPAGKCRWTERYDGKRDLYFQHAA
jgi:hypothetical protein